MAAFQYVSNILSDALFRAQEPPNSNSDYYNQAVVYLNTVYMQICRGGAELAPSINEDWTWLHKLRPGVLTLRPALTGTCTVFQDSTSVVLSPTQPTSLLNYFFRVDGHPDVFRVVAHENGTEVSLDAAYTGVDAAGVAYTTFQLEHDLASDVMRVTGPMNCYVASAVGSAMGRYKIYRVALDNLNTWGATNTDTGVPDAFAEVGPVTAGIRRVRFNRYLGEAFPHPVRVEYDYLYRPTDLVAPGSAQEPVLPLEWRHLLSDYLLAYLFGQKNDDRAGAAAQAAQAGLVGMAQENRYQMTTAAPDLFRIKARAQGMRGPLRTESGHIIG